MAHKNTFSLDDAPPKDDAPSMPDKKPRIHKSAQVTISTGIEDFYTSIGLLVALANQKDGEIVIEHAARAAEAWDRAARKNPRIKAALERFLTASTVAEVVALHVGILAKIAANHDWMPEKMADILAKDTAESNGSGGGFPFEGFDPESIPKETLEEIFPQLKVEP